MFARGDDSGIPDLWTMNADGSDPMRVLGGGTFDSAPDYGPDG